MEPKGFKREMGCRLFGMTCDAAVPGLARLGIACRLGTEEIRACQGRRYDRLCAR